jgi:uncharacterized protein (DUF1697 family)
MRYAAFLRGVMPANCSMPALKKAFEDGGFTDVKTVLASGNVVFDAPKTSIPALEKRVEAAIEKGLGKSFMAIVRPVETLRQLLEKDPFKAHRVKPGSKQIVTFLRKPPASLDLPIEKDNARILQLEGNDLFTAYLPTPKGPVFMQLIEKAAGGKEQTTRTWQTLGKVVAAGRVNFQA